MDMTPMIDVTFQLIIFFMLINNIISEETVEMIVPKLEDPKTYELSEVKKVTVNVAPVELPSVDERRDLDNPLQAPGDASSVHVGMDRFDVGDRDGIAEAIKADVTLMNSRAKAEGNEATVEVLLRADGVLYYDAVEPVMGDITRAEISKVNLVAYLPEDGGENVNPNAE
jgi:biopolymer transport protein ExbD